MRVLVTGAAGFLGSHLVDRLLADGHSVIGLDDFSTGWREHLPARHRHFRLVHGSVLDAGLIDDLASEVDTGFHLAARRGPTAEQRLQGLLTNIHGTLHVAEAAQRHDVCLVLASSGEIYGKNAKPLLREDDDRVLGAALTARWTFAEAKALDESIVDSTARELGLRAVIARLFTTVGPRQSQGEGMVVHRFVAQALAGQPLVLYGNGRQVRSFCHVDDVVSALVRLASLERASGTAVNLGSEHAVTIEELAHRVIALTGSESPLVGVPVQQHPRADGAHEPQRRVPDCSRARELLDFRPQWSLEDIVRAVIDEQQSASRTVPAAAT